MTKNEYIDNLMLPPSDKRKKFIATKPLIKVSDMELKLLVDASIRVACHSNMDGDLIVNKNKAVRNILESILTVPENLKY